VRQKTETHFDKKNFSPHKKYKGKKERAESREPKEKVKNVVTWEASLTKVVRDYPLVLT
jgi:hypothetical protein